MKINDIVNENTTAGSIATVASPMSTQKRSIVGKGVYGNEKAGNLLTGKKTNKKYANSIHESKMKELATDLRDMDNGNFQKKYKKSKEQIKFLLGDPDAKKTVHEAHLEEDDLIIVPGQGHKLKSGFIPHGQSRIDHEVEMARSDLFSAAKNAKQVYELIADLTEEEGLEGWVQEKIIKANDYLNSIREYLEGKQLRHNEMTGGVVAGGGVGEGQVNELSSELLSRAATKAAFRQRDTAKALHDLENEPGTYFDPEMRGRPGDMHPARKFWSDKSDKFARAAANKRAMSKDDAKLDAATSQMSPAQKRQFDKMSHVEEEGKGLWANIHAKRERIKKGSGERMRKPGSKGAPSAQDFKDAAKEGVGEKIKGVVRREKAKDLPLLQTRRDYAMGKAGAAYEKGDTRKGNQYSAWAEKDRKKKNDPTTNPAGTYRTKTTDYSKDNK